MREGVEDRLRALARRAGWAGAPPVVVAAGLGLAAVAVVAAAWRWWPESTGAASGLVERSASATADAGESGRAGVAASSAPGARAIGSARAGGDGSSQATICVHVVGAVRHPGVYVLPDGTRVEAAVEAAGGASPRASTDAINLASKLSDGEQVVVPTREQVADGEVPAASSGASGGVKSPGAPGAMAKVDLNTADATQLDTLPGVGPSTAAKIVADRQSNGPYRTVDDLGRVPGIGPKKLDQLRDLVVVR